MKIYSLIASVAVLAVMASSCGVLGGTTATTTDGTTSTTTVATTEGYNAGQTSGTALKNLYTQYVADGNKLNLGNANNLLNIASLAANIQGMKGQTEKKTYFKDFAKGLILGSNDLVNQDNATKVANSLCELAGTDLTSVQTAAQNASDKAAGYASQASTALNNAANIANSVTSILSLFGTK